MKGITKKQIQKYDQQKKITRKEWTKEEDRKLQKIIDQNGSNWKVVSSAMQDRNPSQCAQRWKRIKPESEKNRKGWTQEEDDQLLRLIGEHQTNWSVIACVMSWRTGKQIRERYINQLNPDIKNSDWTKEEDLLVLRAYQELGSKWTEISKRLNGRPENSIKNRFYSHIRQAYMNIENPYYVIPSKSVTNERKSKIIPSDLHFIKEEFKVGKQRSLSFDSIQQNKVDPSRKPQNQQQFNEFVMGTYSSSKDSKKSFKPEDMYPPLYATYRPQDLNPELFIGAYNQPIFSYSLNSEKKYQQDNNRSISIQMSSVPISVPPFQLYKHSGMSEEVQSHNSEQRMVETLGFFQHPFSQLFNNNIIAVPVLMRNDLDTLGIQMDNIRINEKK